MVDLLHWIETRYRLLDLRRRVPLSGRPVSWLVAAFVGWRTSELVFLLRTIGRAALIAWALHAWVEVEVLPALLMGAIGSMSFTPLRSRIDRSLRITEVQLAALERRLHPGALAPLVDMVDPSTLATVRARLAAARAHTGSTREQMRRVEDEWRAVRAELGVPVVSELTEAVGTGAIAVRGPVRELSAVDDDAPKGP